MLYRYGLVFRHILTMPSFDVCQVARQTNLFTKQIIKYVESVAPSSFKPCPRIVSFCFRKNFTWKLFFKSQELTFKEVPILTNLFLDIVPSEDYRLIFHIHMANASLAKLTADGLTLHRIRTFFGWKIWGQTLW